MALRLVAFAAGAATLAAADGLPPPGPTTKAKCGDLAYDQTIKGMTDSKKADLQKAVDKQCAADPNKLSCSVQFLSTAKDFGSGIFAVVYDECIKAFNLDTGASQEQSCLQITGKSTIDAAFEWYYDAGNTNAVQKAQFAKCEQMFGGGHGLSSTCDDFLQRRFSQAQVWDFEKCKFKRTGGLWFPTAAAVMTQLTDIVKFRSECASCKLSCIGGVCYSYNVEPTAQKTVTSYSKVQLGSEISVTPMPKCWGTFVDVSPKVQTKDKAKESCLARADCLGITGNDVSDVFYMMKGSQVDCALLEALEKEEANAQRKVCEKKVHSATAVALSLVDQGNLASCMRTFAPGPSAKCWGIGTNLNKDQINEIEAKCADEKRCTEYIVNYYSLLNPVSAEKLTMLQQCQSAFAENGCIDKVALSASETKESRALAFSLMTLEEQKKELTTRGCPPSA